jgi:dolichyl-phosphate-mannose--protein O-mannosyl transferase
MTGVAATYTDSPDAVAPSRVSPRALRARLVPPFVDSALWGWVGPLLVTAVAAYLRFNRLSIPGSKAFDEVYYAHDAQSLLMYGVETGKNGPPETFGPVEYVVHPPLGKWMIGFGEWISNYNSFGWRLSAAIVGTLSVLLVARIARRMTRSTLFGCAAGLLMCLDGLEYVQSRMAMLDIFLMFWVVVAFGFLILDRDHVRSRVAARAAAINGPDDARGFGPRVGFRWWLLASGISLGAATACKWNGAYFIPAFALLAMFWTMGAKRAAGVQKPFVSTLARDVPGGLLTMVLAPIATYIASWTGWFLSNASHAYDRAWANGRSTAWGMGWVPAWLRNPVRGLWHYHWEMWNFATHLDTYHKYRSNGWGWLFLNRPVLYYADYPHYGKLGCQTRASSGCARMIYNLGTPAIWWASIPVMCFMLYLVFRRDWRASAVLVPFLFGYLPWLFTFKRTMFFFYALPLLPFISIALALTMGYMVGDRKASPNRRMVGAMVTGSYMLIVVVLFFYFLPVLSERTIPFTGWQQRMWFQSWSEDSGS